MTDGLFENIKEDLGLNFDHVERINPLVLAYLGDAVYEVYVRTLLVSRKPLSVNKLHRLSVDFVKAKAQSDILHKIMDSLTEQEREIVRMGRNAKSGTIPKNANVVEYKYSTAFEALVGYLYLSNDKQRLMEVLRMSVALSEG